MDGDTDTAEVLHNAVLGVRLDGFRGNKVKKNKIWRAIKAIVKDDAKSDDLLKIVIEQAEY